MLCRLRGAVDTEGARMLGDMPVWYLFLGGSGAGLLLVASVMMLLVPLSERMMALGIARGPEEVRAAHRSLSRVFVPACAGSGALLAMGASASLPIWG